MTILLSRLKKESTIRVKMEKYIIPMGEALNVYEANGTFFDKCVDELKAEGLEVITAKQLAEARMLGGVNHPVSRKWTWTAENFNYLPNGDILVASKGFNPLLQYPVEATNCHRQNPFMEFYLSVNDTENLRRAASSDVNQAMKFGVLLLKRSKVLSDIPVEAFGEEDVTSFLFGDKAEDYGKFLKENGINNAPLYVVDKAHAQKQGKAFSRPLWAYGFSLNSALGGYGSLSDGDGRAFGVRRSEQPEAASQGLRAERSEPRNEAGRSDRGALSTPTLEQVLAVTESFTAECNKEALKARLEALYQKPKK